MVEDTESFNLIINPTSLPMNVTRGTNDRAAVTIIDNDGQCHMYIKLLIAHNMCATMINLMWPDHFFFNTKSKKKMVWPHETILYF